MNQLTTLLTAKNIDVGVGNFRILKDINWVLSKNQHWIITGENGAGKTVLARALSGKGRIMKGELSIYGKVAMVSFTDTSKLFRSVNATHYYQQRFNAFDADGHLTVEEYLKMGGYEKDKPEHSALLKSVGIDHLIEKERIKLSSGQTRKMFLVSAILQNPQILILDNPYIGIDAKSRVQLNNLLDAIVEQQGLHLILSGHYEDLPQCISHRIHLEKGSVRSIGSLSVVQEAVGNVYNKGSLEKLQELKKYYKQQTKISPYETILKLEGVTVKYGHTTILENLNWIVKPGEKWSLKGQNGSGKSTLISLVYGDNPQAYANQIFLFDKRRGRGQSIWEVKKLIGFTSSELHVFFDDNPLAIDLVLTGLFDGFALRKMPKPEVIQFARWLFQYFGIDEYYATPFNQLSTGIQRLLFFLRALIKVPPVLFLDEPFQGLDNKMMQRGRNLLDHLLDERHTLIFVTHFEKEIPQQVEQSLRLD